MRNPKATTKRQRIQALVDHRIYDRVVLLSQQEVRSESHMTAILIEEALDARGVAHTVEPIAANS